MLEEVNDADSGELKVVSVTPPAKPLTLARSIFEVSDAPGASLI
jgi:hypothetical protein